VVRPATPIPATSISARPSRIPRVRAATRRLLVVTLSVVVVSTVCTLLWTLVPVGSVVPVVLALQGLGPLNAAAALVVAVALACLRANRLALLALVASLVWAGYTHTADRAAAASSDGPSGRSSGEVCEGQTLTVAAANLLLSNLDRDALVETLAGIPASVLVTAETSPGLRRRLEAETGWRHVATGGGDRGTTTDLWVRATVAVSDLRWVDTSASTLPAARVTLGDGTWTWVVAVHLTAPVGRRQAALWRAEVPALAAEVGQLGDRVVLAGDFNTSIYHREYRALAAQFAHAARSTGQRWVRTWPADHRLGPALDLDHVLAHRSMHVCAYGEMTLPGSDHRGVWASVSHGGR